MKYYLYKFSDNWADEMDLEGFAILTENQKDVALTKIKREFKKGGTISFGTNEDNEYENLNAIMGCIEIDTITSQQYHTMKSIFPDGYFGQLGPLDYDSLDEFPDDDNEDEAELCSECGEELEEGDDEFCASCQEDVDEEEEYEQLYYAQAKKICEFIRNEYGLEETSTSNCYSKFLWKPTNKTELEIEIQEYQDGNDDEEVELTLRLNGKEMRYDFFKIDDICDNLELEFKKTIKEYIDKAKKY